jgi:hypothetical protein
VVGVVPNEKQHPSPANIHSFRRYSKILLDTESYKLYYVK